MAVIPLSVQEWIVISLFVFLFFLALMGVFLFIAVVLFRISIKVHEEVDAQNRISWNQKENPTKSMETPDARS